MERRRILFISSWYPNRTKPTNGDFVQRHAQAISSLNQVILLHVVFDINLDNKRELIYLTRNGFPEYIVYFNTLKFFRFAKQLKLIYLYLLYFKKIEKEHGKIDLVHANIIVPIGVIALLFKFLYKIPFVITEHWSGFSPKASSKISKFKVQCIKFIARHAKCIMPVSMLLQECMQKIGIHGNYSVVGNVVQTQTFCPKERRNILPHKILHVSTLNEEYKNIRGILRAIKGLSLLRNDFVIEFVSENSGEELLQYAKELSIDHIVVFLGQKNREELAVLMQGSAFFLLFSNFETFSCVIIEALASGIPVISTKTVGIASHITMDKGLLVEKENESELIEKMNIMLDTYLNYDSMSLHNFAKNHFSFSNIAQAFDAIYKS